MNRRNLLTTLTALLVVQSVWLGLTRAPNLFYVANVFVHVFGGILLAAILLWVGGRGVLGGLRQRHASALWGAAAWLLFLGSLLPAAFLVWRGNRRETYVWLTVHIVLAFAAVTVALVALLVHVRGEGGEQARGALRRLAAGAVAALLLALGLFAWKAVYPDPRNRVDNPARPPFTMAGEAMGGEDGPFFPSAAETSTGGRIPSDFFMTSESCGQSGCHPDILEQWQASAHRFSSFNNQWYRKSIEYMQSVNSVQSSKWCAGCHDHAVIFNGMMDRPIQEIVHTPEAQVGLSCNSCHAIVHVKDTMGNGGFHIEYPPLHDLSVSENPFLKGLHDLAVHLDPGPHRSVFLKPFHRRDGEHQAEFCSTCHKVHLDVPVNNYRWIRGFNEYDNWQASGVSGQGARSFYYPPEPKTCGDCHMPRVRSDDAGNVDGYVHDHSFLAANTATALSHLERDQLRRTIEFLQADQVTVDIFAAGPARAPDGPEDRMRAGPGVRPGTRETATSFAVGEEAATAVGRGGVALEPPSPIWAPLDAGTTTVRPGETIRVDVVVRTRGLGHFFPGGTVDAYDTWLELRARHGGGDLFFWSGVATEGGKGPVDPSAHMYRALMVDAHGNPIDKRNAWANRAVVYVNLIPPGAADTAHFRLHVPEDAEGEIHLEARLNYRKFSWFNTRFSFAGEPAPGEPRGSAEGGDRVTPHWDDREFVFGEVPEDVSAARRVIPDLPIVVMDVDEAVLRVAGANEPASNPGPAATPAHRERWNDYGIGLLRQGDLKGAERAFLQVIAADPSWADGYVNVARARLQEGDLAGAREMLGEALELAPDLAKAHHFMGVALKEGGEYEAALEHLREAARQYPRDRVVRNTIGRTLFLQRRYEEAEVELLEVLEIDAEDLTAHYNLMLTYKGLGRLEDAEASRLLYERFKADEDAQSITGPYRRRHPDDNRERMPIHEHPSVPAEVIAQETAIRSEHGEPTVVLPGEVEGYLDRVFREDAPGSSP